MNAFTLWKLDSVKITKAAEHMGKYRKTELSERQYCTKCGGHILTTHPPWGLIDVYAAILPSLKFEPGVHVNYAKTVLPMKDGFPILKGFPEELGGSGETVLERFGHEWYTVTSQNHTYVAARREATRAARCGPK